MKAATSDAVQSDAAAPMVMPVNKDQSRAPDGEAAPSKTPGPAVGLIGPVKPRTGHIAAFVSRKDGKLYVRQNFEPLFDAPVTVAEPAKPLGTHVFTVRAAPDDPASLRWSVVSLPAQRLADKRADASRGRTSGTEAALVAASTPSEALDRLTIPPDAMQRITAAIAPGGSLVVSDQGLGDETGLGTDFIVPLRGAP
jgi:hypothetical protein